MADYDPMTDSDDDGEARLELEARDQEAATSYECADCECCTADTCNLRECADNFCPCTES